MAAMLMMTGCQANAQTSGLPLITIQAETELNAQKKVTAHMEMEGYNGAIGIKLRGNSSLSFNQKKYTFETRDENGKEQDVSLLGMPAHSDWVLLAPYNDVSMVRDPLALRWDTGDRVPRWWKWSSMATIVASTSSAKP